MKNKKYSWTEFGVDVLYVLGALLIFALIIIILMFFKISTYDLIAGSFIGTYMTISLWIVLFHKRPYASLYFMLIPNQYLMSILLQLIFIIASIVKIYRFRKGLSTL